MAFPPPAEELSLHERVLAGDPVASADVFTAFMDPLFTALRRDLPCTDDEKYDSAVDAVFKYLSDPVAFDRSRGRLSTYLMDIAKKRATDRLRSRTASERRDETYTNVVQLRVRDPKEVIETVMLAHELWPRVEAAVPSEQDRAFLKLYLGGERSTAAFAELLGITGLPRDEIRLKVKQHQDRLLKVLKRLGARLNNDAKS